MTLKTKVPLAIGPHFLLHVAMVSIVLTSCGGGSQ